MIKSLALLVAVLLGSVAAEAGTYEIDAVHSEVGFKIRHMMVAKSSGRFGKFSGSFDYDGKDHKKWATKAVIDAASIDTNNAKRDDHLRAPDFFDVAKYPTIEFVSSKVSGWKNGSGKLHGKLTMHGVTKDVVLDLESVGEIRDEKGSRAGFTARGKIDRRDFGIVWNKTLDKGGLSLGNDVELTLEIEGIATK